MGNIYAFRPKATGHDRLAVLTDLVAEEQRGTLRSFMYFAEGSDGKTRYGVHGGFADRLQFAAHTLVQALHTVTDRIADTGTAGYTDSPPISETVRRRPLPRDLKGTK